MVTKEYFIRGKGSDDFWSDFWMEIFEEADEEFMLLQLNVRRGDEKIPDFAQWETIGPFIWESKPRITLAASYISDPNLRHKCRYNLTTSRLTQAADNISRGLCKAP